MYFSALFATIKKKVFYCYNIVLSCTITVKCNNSFININESTDTLGPIEMISLNQKIFF